MAYHSDKWTDKELEALEKRIAQVFKDAEKDLQKEVNDYFAKFKLRDKEMQALVNAGEMTKAEYQQWRMTQIGRGQHFEALRDKVAERYTQANEVANAYVNDATPSIYSLNRNYEAYTIEKAVGSCDFTMWDESTVRRLLVEEPDLMPYYPQSRALKRGIDLAYGKSQITKHVTSGIIRGLPPGKIANELMSNLTGMNRASAVRAARTGITAAQNAGRMDSYVAAEKMGIQIRRRWVCTKDSRTRLDHGMADGQIVVGTKQPFIVGGYKMMFPGDGSMNAPGFQIYNCRCRTRTVEKDGIEAEPREMRVMNPKWEEARAEETKLEKKLEKLKEREQAETDPAKRKQLRKDRIATQNELKEATKKRQGLDKDLVVNEMTYSEWLEWKNSGVKPLEKSGNGGIVKAGNSVDVSFAEKTYGATHAGKIRTLLEGADDTVKSVWNKYQSKFKASDPNYSGNRAFYHPSTGDVTLNIEKVAKGDSFSKPYQTLYHEYGHMTDYLANADKGWGGMIAFTETFGGVDADGNIIKSKMGEGGLLGNTAKQELKELINATKKKHGVTRKPEAAKFIIEEIKAKYSLTARADVSDMLEGAGIGVDYPLGVGHGKKYWKDRDNGKEIFAEMIAAEVACPESLECMKEYFPETYKVFRQMLEVIK
jgi:hypothetical protein